MLINNNYIALLGARSQKENLELIDFHMGVNKAEPLQFQLNNKKYKFDLILSWFPSSFEIEEFLFVLGPISESVAAIHSVVLIVIGWKPVKWKVISVVKLLIVDYFIARSKNSVIKPSEKKWKVESERETRQ